MAKVPFADLQPPDPGCLSDRGAARGSSSQAPIDLDDDSEPTAPLPRNATYTHLHQHHQHHLDNFWGVLTPGNTHNPQSLPSFSDFAANLDFQPLGVTALLHNNAAPQTPGHEANSDEYLSALVEGNSRHTQASPGSRQQRQQQPRRPSLAQSPQNAPRRHASGTPLRPDRLSRDASQNTNTVLTAARQPTSRSAYHDNEVEESLFVSSDDEPQVTMPVQTRRRASTILSSDHDPESDEIAASATRKRPAPSSAPARETTASKRRRTSQPQATRPQTTTPGVLGPDDDIFGEEKVPSKKGKEKDEDIIDLADANEVPEDLKAPKEDKRIKLSAFQCVICMDDVTALTVTHCGHLFCSECLHSALNVDATKNKCPICRQKVETKDKSEYTTKTKGFWPLELKLMTASRKGKQRA